MQVLGGLVGGLIGLGIPEDEAKEYEGYVDSGKILVLVDDNGRGRDIHQVFSGSQSLNSSRYNNVYSDPTVDGTLNNRDTTDTYNRNRL